jgi:hypothetical protein
MMVPDRPTSVLICRYLPPPERVHSRRFALAGELHPDVRDGAARLAAELNALHPFPRTAMSCPELGGRTDLLIFDYSDSRTTRVRVAWERCVPVSNGRLLRVGIDLPGPAERHWPDEGLL